MKSRFVILLYFVASVLITLNRGIWNEHRVIIWDGTGYYMYLPAAVIHQDLGQLAFYSHIDSLYHPSDGLNDYGIHRHETTGRRSTRYPAGVALFELPGFLAAHALTMYALEAPADGYSAPYQLAVALSTILWAGIGLIILRRFLLRYYPEPVVWKALLLISFGTNFYYYTAFFQGWSHAYSFFIVAAVLSLTDRWYREPNSNAVLWLGAVFGLALITRPSNAVLAVIPLFWPSGTAENRGKFLRKRWRALSIAALLFGAVLMIQLAYWKYTTGQWVYYSYTDEGFDFLHPKIWKGLFSYRKGWFVYTPLALAFCLGMFALRRQHRGLLLPVAAYITLHIYVVFSWKIWHYASSFSCRPMVEALPVLAIPACALVRRVEQLRARWLSIVSGIIAALLIALNLFQTYQFSLKDISFDRMTRAYYWRIFGKLSVTEEDQKLLLPVEEARSNE